MAKTDKWKGLDGLEAVLLLREEEAQMEEELKEKGELPPDYVPKVNFTATPEQRKLISDLSTAGIRLDQITLLVKWPDGMPISVPTLLKHFREELSDGTLQANAQVAGSLFKLAMSGNIAAQCFWLKTRGKWRETNHFEVTGKDGKDLPIGSGVIVMPATPTSEDWERVSAEEQRSLANRAASYMAGQGEFATPKDET